MQPAPPQEDSRIGMVLQDRYRIIRKLGEGGMGAVYEGEHVLIKRRVAIKCLHSQFAQSGEIVARFHREALAATSVGNEHIIEVTDMGRFPDGAVFMVLEFLAGHDFAHEIEKVGPMPVGRVAHVCAQVCEALGAAHEKGIVHRDLKPENVFLIQRGGDPDFVKVLDFGISKFKDSGEGGGGGNYSMTRTGMAMGTPYYMAPEQAHGHKDLDHRVDIYALGVLMFRALTGALPFDDDSYAMLVVKICTQPPPSVRQYRPDVPPQFEAIIMKMLAKDKNARFPDCASARAALLPFRAVTGAAVLATGATMAGDALLTPPTPVLGSNVPTKAPAIVEAARPAGTPASTPAMTASFASPSSAGNRMGLVLGGLAVVAFIGAGVVFMKKKNEPAAVPVVQSQSNGASAGNPVATGPGTSTALAPPGANTAAGGAAPAQRMVRVQISSNPVGAELYLDGNRIANPFDADLPSSGETHRLEARMADHATYLQDLSLAFGQRVIIPMRRGQGVEDHRAARGASSGGGTPAVVAAREHTDNGSQSAVNAPPPAVATAPAMNTVHVDPPAAADPPQSATPTGGSEEHHAAAAHVARPATPPPEDDPPAAPPPTNPAIVVPPQTQPLRHRAF